MSYSITLPQIDNVEISPRQTTTNGEFFIAVAVSEYTKILEPIYFYSDEIYAGEFE